MNSLRDSFTKGGFLVTLELEPPKGADLAPLTEAARELGPRVDAIVIADNPRAEARLAPLAAALAAKGAGAEVILTLSCRDRNRLSLTSELLAAGSAGLRNLLLVSGDHPSLGDHPGAKPVYDLDSVTALSLAASLAQGRDLAGGELSGAPEFFSGAACAPESLPLEPQIMKIRKKLSSGAGFLMSLPLSGAGAWKEFLARAGLGQVKALAGVACDNGRDAAGAGSLVEELRSMGAAGVHLTARDPGAYAEVLKAAGR